MKKKMLALSIFLFGFLGTLNLVRAQATDNKIQEVFINSGDGFGELRKLLKDNFDFTNQDYKEGVVNSDVRFSLSEDGKITNVHANGDCKNVSKEIENVLSHLIYKVDMEKLSQKMVASSYVMPVSVTIDNR
ncbi:MAG: hypothetical protein J0I88_10960 [Chryseobacterium sp.]|jgi:hypothetical protein|nr:hypothetical protein [Chryseobacterium sp.]OJX31719.1 MAG: hypothetical protein BGO86_07330 [Chryseobacterium sp. 36-9]